MTEIKRNAEGFLSPHGITRKSEVILNRLRSGHCRFTHAYLMEGYAPPLCMFCQDAIMSVKHIFIDCIGLTAMRAQHFGSANFALIDVIGDHVDTAKVFRFLEEIGLLSEI